MLIAAFEGLVVALGEAYADASGDPFDEVLPDLALKLGAEDSSTG